MKCLGAVSAFSFVTAGLFAMPASAGTFDVTQHHKHQSRDGLYVDPAFTSAAAANIARDLNFTGAITGNVYAQPLYIENGPGGAAMVIAVTQSNNVYALDATTGAIIWQRNVGTPITSGLPCGNLNPLGITNTPVVDLASRSLFFDAETTPSAGTFKHLIFSLNVDTGDINFGWPVDTAAVVPGFTSSWQSSRAALGLVNGIVYVPYGGRFGDCGSYRGRVVGVEINNPSMVLNWATTAIGGGVWGVGGVASDGTNTYVTTGNTFSTGGNWGGGEAVIKLLPGPVFSGATTDYWAPTNWLSLDNADADLGGTGALLVDVPGAAPSALVVALGKDGNAYLLNRNNLGGITSPVSQSPVGAGSIIQAAATYRTSMGTYVVFRRTSSTLTAFRITATTPPTIATGWTVTQSGRGSPWVTTTDGTNDVIVWVVGAEGSQRLNGYNGDTGATVFAGGGANELMTGTRRFNTGIAARGRIYYAADNRVYAFTVPTGATPTPTPPPTPSPSPAPSPTPTPTPPSTPSPTPIPTITPTPTPTPSGSPSTPTPTLTPSPTPTTPTPTPAFSPTPPPTPTPTPTPGETPAPTATPTPGGSATPTATPSGTPSPTPGGPPAKALNISTRLRVETGGNVAIGGFIVSGTAPKDVVIRGVGPSLSGSGVPNALADPILELRGGDGTLIRANDNWQDDSTQAGLITAAGLALQSPNESGIAATLQPGNSFTAVLAGKNQTTGVGLIEIYDTNSAANSQLANISTRGFVQTGSDVMIGGFILGSGNGNSRVVVRGIGPSLSGILNPVLADPTLELHDSNGATLISNDNWQDDPLTASQLTFLGLAPQDSNESGIYRSLPPGLYTAILAGKNGGTGIGLIEVYNIQ